MKRTLLPLLVMFLLSACKKESEQLCSSCNFSTAQTKIAEGKLIVESVFNERLQNWGSKGYCDTCYTDDAAQCLSIASSIAGNPDGSLCDSAVYSFKVTLQSAIAAALDVSVDLDSAEVADANTRFSAALSEIIQCK